MVPRASNRRALVVRLALGLAVVLAFALAPLAVPLLACAAVVVALRTPRSQPLLRRGLVCASASVLGLAAGFVLAVSSASASGSAARALDAAARAAGAAAVAALVAAVLLLAAAWARRTPQRAAVWTAAGAAVVLVLATTTVWVTWGIGFDLADAGRSTAAVDAVMVPAFWAGVAALVVAAAAAGTALVRSRPAAPRLPSGS